MEEEEEEEFLPFSLPILSGLLEIFLVALLNNRLNFGTLEAFALFFSAADA